MSEYRKIVAPIEGDYYRMLPPSSVLKLSLEFLLHDIRRDGGDRSNIYPATGAVWMISRMRIYQYQPVNVWDELCFRSFPRVIERGRYIFYMEAYRGEELVIRFDTVFIPVNAAERKVIDASLIEPYWTSPPREAESKHLERMDMEAEYCKGGSVQVRMSDCDSNRHLTSPRYLSMICDELGFWDGEPKFMQFFQIDFASEVLPGTELRFEIGERGERKLVRGYKEDGTLAFSAACIF